MSTVEPGDFVRDRMDGGNIREVATIDGNTMHMVDGGVMGVDEVKPEDILLESEMFGEENDHQPTHYEEMQDYMGGDDWDHGQYDDGGEW